MYHTIYEYVVLVVEMLKDYSIIVVRETGFDDVDWPHLPQGLVQ
jgi:hypothetical protein